jgi:hypothetical protein
MKASASTKKSRNSSSDDVDAEDSDRDYQPTVTPPKKSNTSDKATPVTDETRKKAAQFRWSHDMTIALIESMKERLSTSLTY